MNSYILFGCANPDYPEPYDPMMLCGKCAKELEEYFIGQFKAGNLKVGHWGKSNAERKAAISMNLVWVGNNCLLEYEGRRLFNEYIPKDILDKIKISERERKRV